MEKVKNLTAVVLTKNEEKNLPQCLKSLDFVDQILVIDDFSTDQTPEIAKKFNARVVTRKLDDFASGRNFALKKVETDWTLMIDADEEIPAELAQEITWAIKKENFVGFKFRRKNYFFGRWMKHAGWYPDWQLHLFKTKKAKYRKKVHEQVELKGKVGKLKNHLIHYNYENIAHFLSERKFNLYTQLEAKQLMEGGYKFNWQDLISKPVNEFLRRFFAEKGYQERVLGLIVCLLQAVKELVIYAKIWEKQKPEKPVELLVGLEKQREIEKKKFDYWFLTSKIEKTQNPLKKIIIKLKRKLT